jgi:DNA-binding transcriptional regulator/RsmH inhibitor MraZ
MPSTAAVATVTKMMEALPEPAQDRVVEHLRDYIAEVWDEAQWEAAFEKTQDQLVVAARRAKEEIAAGHAEPMDYERLG